MKYLLILTMLLSGCATAHWVSRTNSPKGGTIRYLNDELVSAMTERHRNKALSDMSEYCGTEPNIISEGQTAENGDYYSDDGRWTYFRFTCN